MTIANSVLLMHDVSFEAISFACPSGLGANLLSTLYKSSSSLGKKQKKKHTMLWSKIFGWRLFLDRKKWLLESVQLDTNKNEFEIGINHNILRVSLKELKGGR